MPPKNTSAQTRGGFKKIVVAFDGSNDAVKAVELASRLAKAHEAEVTVVHVYSIPTYPGIGVTFVPQFDMTTLQREAKERANGVLARGVSLAEESGVKANGQLLQGASIVQALVEFAENTRCDLFVIGTRGLTGFRKLVVGSVSSGVVSHAHCAVMVVR